MTAPVRDNSKSEIWAAFDRIAAVASVVIVAFLTYIYFQIPSWSSLTQQAREFLMGLIVNVIPVYILFATSYFLFRQFQRIRDREDSGLVARQIADEVRASLREQNSTRLQVNDSLSIPKQILKTREEIVAANIQLIGSAKQDVISFSGDLSWTKQSHLALMDAISQGVSVRVLCKDPLTDEAKQHVRKYLRQAGIEIKYYPPNFDPDVRGLMADTLISKRAIFVEKKHKALGDNYQRTGAPGDSVNYEYWGQQFNAENDFAVVSPLAKLFEILWTQAREADVLHSADWRSVEAGLRRVRQYQNALLNVRSVKVANLKPLHRFIDLQEYRHIQGLAAKLQRHNVPLWGLVSIDSAKGQKIICPPIIEVHDSEWFILDGLARVYHARQLGLGDMVACVIEGVSEPLVGTSWTWDRVQLMELPDYTKSENFQKPNLQYWRDLDSVHSYLESITPA